MKTTLDLSAPLELSRSETIAVHALNHLIECGTGGLSMAHRIVDQSEDSRLIKTKYPQLYIDPKSAANWVTQSQDAYYVTLSALREALVEYEAVARRPHIYDALWSTLEYAPVCQSRKEPTVHTDSTLMPNPYSFSLARLKMVSSKGIGGEVIDSVGVIENIFTQFKGGVRYNEQGYRQSYTTS